MKLLLDHNLPPSLVARLADIFPNSNHVYHLGLDRTVDEQIWDFAQTHEFMIVTKDVDFSELCLLRGFLLK